MQTQNTIEYKIVREDLRELKECITHYMGFVLGGSGVAIFGLSALKFLTDQSYSLAYASSFLTVTITLVLLLLFYKFTSHNRFAGYCKLLNHERFRRDNGCNSYDLIAWEMCIDRLRYGDLISSQVYARRFEKIEIAEIDSKDKELFFIHFAKTSGKNAEIDVNKHWKGFIILMKMLKGEALSASWGYPPLVVSLFFLLCLGFLLTGIFGTLLSISADDIKIFPKITLCIVMLIILTCQFFAWRFFCGKLYSLMEGSNTVDSFYLRFIPIRTEILNELGIIPLYLHLRRHLKCIDQKNNIIE